MNKRNELKAKLQARHIQQQARQVNIPKAKRPAAVVSLGFSLKDQNFEPEFFKDRLLIKLKSPIKIMNGKECNFRRKSRGLK